MVFDTYVKQWSDEDLDTVFQYIKDWNTNAKHSYLCSTLLDALIRVFGCRKLAGLKSVASVLPVIAAYSEKHFDRIGRLFEGSHLTDYLCSLFGYYPADALVAGGAESAALQDEELAQFLSRDANSSDSRLEDGKQRSAKRQLTTEPAPLLFAPI